MRSPTSSSRDLGAMRGLPERKFVLVDEDEAESPRDESSLLEAISLSPIKAARLEAVKK